MAKVNWYGYEPSRDPYMKGKKTTKLNNAIFEAKNRGMDYVRAKYGSQITSQIEKTITSSLHGPRYNTPGAHKGYDVKGGPFNGDPWKKGADWSTKTRGGIPRAEVTVDELTGKDRTAWDSSRFTGDSKEMHAPVTPDGNGYVPPPSGPPVWQAHGQWNLENDKALAQGNQRPGAQATSISSMITGLLRQSQEAAGDTLQGMMSQAPGQYYLGARDSTAWGVDPIYAPPGSQLPVPTDFGAPRPDPGDVQHAPDPTTSFGNQQAGQAPSADDILSSSLGGLGFLAGAVAPGNNVNTTMGSGAAAPQQQPGQAATGDPAPAPAPKSGWQPDGKGGWQFNDSAGKPITPPSGSPPKPTTPSPVTPNPTAPPPAGGDLPGGYGPNSGGKGYGNTTQTGSALYNPWGYGLGGGGIDASGHPVNASMGPSPAFMANATMQAMSLANSYFAPQRLELAYQLGDMETDMRRMAVNLGRQTDDPVLQAKLFKEANQATRTLDTQQNTFAFQMAEQRRQEEQQNWQFYSSLAQEEYKFTNQLDLAQRTFDLQRYQVMNSSTAPPVTNAFANPTPAPAAGTAMPGQTTQNDSGALQGGNLVAGSLNPYGTTRP
jgi:hypothetical protein